MSSTRATKRPLPSKFYSIPEEHPALAVWRRPSPVRQRRLEDNRIGNNLPRLPNLLRPSMIGKRQGSLKEEAADAIDAFLGDWRALPVPWRRVCRRQEHRRAYPSQCASP